MSSGYQLKDLTDLVDAVARELKIQDSDTVERERIKEDLNDLYLNEVAAKKRWPWLQGHVDVQFKPYYGSGTVSVTPDSTTVTLSVAPAASLGSFAGKFFSVDNFNEIYTIDSHTAQSTTVVLKSAFTGTLNATASFKIWTDQVALPTDCRETVEVWHDFMSQPLEPLGHQELRKRQAESPKAQARPFYYNTYDFVDPTPLTDETESDRYRVLKVYPAIYSDSTTIHIDYVKEVSHLVDDADEPLMPMEDRMVLVYGARQLAWLRHRNPEASEMNRVRFDAKLAQMMGKVEEGVDKPQLTPDSLYIARKRGPRLKSLRGLSGTTGGGGSYTAPTYLSGATIAGATITGNVTVNSGITIDGRDISADGAALDALQTLANGKIYIGNASNVATEVTPSGDVSIDNTGVMAISSDVIVDADVNASAAIALSKLAAVTASRVLESSGSGFVSASVITSSELTYLDDVEALTSVVLTDNTTNGTAVTLAATYTAVVLEYSVVRGAANIDIGHIYLTNDGTTAGASPVGTSLGTTGVTFDAVVSGGNVILRYTTTSTGSNATLKYKLHKWAA